jgi:hypothetical protein
LTGTLLPPLLSSHIKENNLGNLKEVYMKKILGLLISSAAFASTTTNAPTKANTAPEAVKPAAAVTAVNDEVKAESKEAVKPESKKVASKASKKKVVGKVSRKSLQAKSSSEVKSEKVEAKPEVKTETK